MIGMHLLILAALIAASAPRLLTHAGWVYRSPGLGIAAWYAAIIAVATAIIAGGLSLIAPWQASHAPVCIAWRWCVQAARGEHGGAGQAAASVAGLAAAIVLGRLGIITARLARAAAALRDRHHDLLTLTGREDPELGVTVVDTTRPLAYTIGGPTRRIVVSTGTLQQLTPAELAAVLAHERAHATGRHDLLLDTVRILAATFPKVFLLAAALQQLSRLVEIRADEIAAAQHEPINLARALVSIATARNTPAGALAATGGDAMERLHRLLTPPPPLSPLRHNSISIAIAVLALMPSGLLLAAQFLPALSACPTMTW